MLLFYTRAKNDSRSRFFEIRMKNLIVAFLLAIFSLSQTIFASTKEIAGCIRMATCQKTFIAAHRANGFGAPENSREAAMLAVNAGVEIIEIDVRFSKDRYLYILHDAHLDRTTSSTGPIKEKIAPELDDVTLKNGETIPMLQDIYDISKGNALLNLHFKVNAVEEVAEWVAKIGSAEKSI